MIILCHPLERTGRQGYHIVFLQQIKWVLEGVGICLNLALSILNVTELDNESDETKVYLALFLKDQGFHSIKQVCVFRRSVSEHEDLRKRWAMSEGQLNTRQQKDMLAAFPPPLNETPSSRQ